MTSSSLRPGGDASRLAVVAGRVNSIVRVHDPQRLVELERCLFSLCGQDHQDVHVIVVTQRFSAPQLDQVKALMMRLQALHGSPKFTLKNYANPEPKDARSALLNFGIEFCDGQYLAFLDYDDTLYPEAYTLLTKRIATSGAAIAFASVRVVEADVHQEFDFVRVNSLRSTNFDGTGLADLLQRGNFCPIHSYLIDRSRLPLTMKWFDTTMTFEEDYDLLLRIGWSAPADFFLLGTFVGDYYYKSDASNSSSVGLQAKGPMHPKEAWMRARIEARRLLCSLSAKSGGGN